MSKEDEIEESFRSVAKFSMKSVFLLSAENNEQNMKFIDVVDLLVDKVLELDKRIKEMESFKKEKE